MSNPFQFDQTHGALKTVGMENPYGFKTTTFKRAIDGAYYLDGTKNPDYEKAPGWYVLDENGDFKMAPSHLSFKGDIEPEGMGQHQTFRRKSDGATFLTPEMANVAKPGYYKNGDMGWQDVEDPGYLRRMASSLKQGVTGIAKTIGESVSKPLDAEMARLKQNPSDLLTSQARLGYGLLKGTAGKLGGGLAGGAQYLAGAATGSEAMKQAGRDTFETKMFTGDSLDAADAKLNKERFEKQAGDLQYQLQTEVAKGELADSKKIRRLGQQINDILELAHSSEADRNALMANRDDKDLMKGAGELGENVGGMATDLALMEATGGLAPTSLGLKNVSLLAKLAGTPGKSGAIARWTLETLKNHEAGLLARTTAKGIQAGAMNAGVAPLEVQSRLEQGQGLGDALKETAIGQVKALPTTTAMLSERVARVTKPLDQASYLGATGNLLSRTASLATINTAADMVFGADPEAGKNLAEHIKGLIAMEGIGNIGGVRRAKLATANWEPFIKTLESIKEAGGDGKQLILDRWKNGTPEDRAILQEAIGAMAGGSADVFGGENGLTKMGEVKGVMERKRAGKAAAGALESLVGAKNALESEKARVPAAKAHPKAAPSAVKSSAAVVPESKTKARASLGGLVEDPEPPIQAKKTATAAAPPAHDIADLVPEASPDRAGMIVGRPGQGADLQEGLNRSTIKALNHPQALDELEGRFKEIQKTDPAQAMALRQLIVKVRRAGGSETQHREVTPDQLGRALTPEQRRDLASLPDAPKSTLPQNEKEAFVRNLKDPQVRTLMDKTIPDMVDHHTGEIARLNAEIGKLPAGDKKAAKLRADIADHRHNLNVLAQLQHGMVNPEEAWKNLNDWQTPLLGKPGENGGILGAMLQKVGLDKPTRGGGGLAELRRSLNDEQVAALDKRLEELHSYPTRAMDLIREMAMEGHDAPVNATAAVKARIQNNESKAKVMTAESPAGAKLSRQVFELHEEVKRLKGLLAEGLPPTAGSTQAARRILSNRTRGTNREVLGPDLKEAADVNPVARTAKNGSARLDLGGTESAGESWDPKVRQAKRGRKVGTPLATPDEVAAHHTQTAMSKEAAQKLWEHDRARMGSNGAGTGLRWRWKMGKDGFMVPSEPLIAAGRVADAAQVREAPSEAHPTGKSQTVAAEIQHHDLQGFREGLKKAAGHLGIPEEQLGLPELTPVHSQEKGSPFKRYQVGQESGPVDLARLDAQRLALGDLPPRKPEIPRLEVPKPKSAEPKPFFPQPLHPSDEAPSSVRSAVSRAGKYALHLDPSKPDLFDRLKLQGMLPEEGKPAKPGQLTPEQYQALFDFMHPESVFEDPGQFTETDTWRKGKAGQKFADDTTATGIKKAAGVHDDARDLAVTEEERAAERFHNRDFRIKGTHENEMDLSQLKGEQRMAWAKNARENAPLIADLVKKGIIAPEETSIGSEEFREAYQADLDGTQTKAGKRLYQEHMFNQAADRLQTNLGELNPETTGATEASDKATQAFHRALADLRDHDIFRRPKLAETKVDPKTGKAFTVDTPEKGASYEGALDDRGLMKKSQLTGFGSNPETMDSRARVMTSLALEEAANSIAHDNSIPVELRQQIHDKLMEQASIEAHEGDMALFRQIRDRAENYWGAMTDPNGRVMSPEDRAAFTNKDLWEREQQRQAAFSDKPRTEDESQIAAQQVQEGVERPVVDYTKGERPLDLAAEGLGPDPGDINSRGLEPIQGLRAKSLAENMAKSSGPRPDAARKPIDKAVGVLDESIAPKLEKARRLGVAAGPYSAEGEVEHSAGMAAGGGKKLPTEHPFANGEGGEEARRQVDPVIRAFGDKVMKILGATAPGVRSETIVKALRASKDPEDQRTVKDYDETIGQVQKRFGKGSEVEAFLRRMDPHAVAELTIQNGKGGDTVADYNFKDNTLRLQQAFRDMLKQGRSGEAHDVFFHEMGHWINAHMDSGFLARQQNEWLKARVDEMKDNPFFNRLSMASGDEPMTPSGHLPLRPGMADRFLNAFQAGGPLAESLKAHDITDKALRNAIYTDTKGNQWLDWGKLADKNPKVQALYRLMNMDEHLAESVRGLVKGSRMAQNGSSALPLELDPGGPDHARRLQAAVDDHHLAATLGALQGEGRLNKDILRMAMSATRRVQNGAARELRTTAQNTKDGKARGPAGLGQMEAAGILGGLPGKVLGVLDELQDQVSRSTESAARRPLAPVVAKIAGDALSRISRQASGLMLWDDTMDQALRTKVEVGSEPARQIVGAWLRQERPQSLAKAVQQAVVQNLQAGQVHTLQSGKKVRSFDQVVNGKRVYATTDLRGNVITWRTEGEMAVYDYIESNGKRSRSAVSQAMQQQLDPWLQMKKEHDDLVWSMLEEASGHAPGTMPGKVEDYLPHLYGTRYRMFGSGAMNPLFPDAGHSLVGLNRAQERTSPTYAETWRNVGLLPQHDNPVDTMLRGHRDMIKMIGLRRALTNLLDNNLAVFDHSGNVDHANYVRLDLGPQGSTAMTRLAFPQAKRGETVEGTPEVFVHREVAPALQSFYKDGLASSKRWGYLYRNFMTLNGVFAPAKLGLSGFHLGTVGKLALVEGVHQSWNLSKHLQEQGVPPAEARARALESLGQRLNFRRMRLQGQELRKVFIEHGSKSMDEIEAIPGMSDHDKAALVMLQVGGYDAYLKPQLSRQMLDATLDSVANLMDGKASAALGTAWHGYRAGLEWATEKIMSDAVAPLKTAHLVENMKNQLRAKYGEGNGWFDAFKTDLIHTRDMGPYASNELREAARQLVSHADNVFGLVNYRNLIQAPEVRDLMKAWNLSYGWRMGTMRELGKGLDQGLQGVSNFVEDKSGVNPYGATKRVLGGTGIHEPVKGRDPLGFMGTHFAVNGVINAALLGLLAAYGKNVWGSKDKKAEDDENPLQTARRHFEDAMFPSFSGRINHNGQMNRMDHGYIGEWYGLARDPLKWAEDHAQGNSTGLAFLKEQLTGHNAINEEIGNASRFLGTELGGKVNRAVEGLGDVPKAIAKRIIHVPESMVPISVSTAQRLNDEGEGGVVQTMGTMLGFRKVSDQKAMGETHAVPKGKEAQVRMEGTVRSVDKQDQKRLENQVMSTALNLKSKGNLPGQVRNELKRLVEAGVWKPEDLERKFTSYFNTDGTPRGPEDRTWQTGNIHVKTVMLEHSPVKTVKARWNAYRDQARASMGRMKPEDARLLTHRVNQLAQKHGLEGL